MPRIQLHQNTVDLVERIIAHLISLHVSNEIDDFLEYLSEAFGTVTAPIPSTVEIEEIYEDDDASSPPSPPQQNGPAQSNHQSQPREATQFATRMDDEHIEFTTQEGRPYIDPNPRREENQAPRPVTVNDEWIELELRLNKALDLSIEAACEERDVFDAFDAFIASYGQHAHSLLGNWPSMIERRRQELSALDRFREERRLKEERQRREAEIRERCKERARLRKEEAERKRAEALSKAKREREEAEEKLRRIQEERQLFEQRLQEEQARADREAREAKRREESVEEEIRKEKNRQKYREAHPRKVECHVCGLQGVKRSKDCPNLHNHKYGRSCGHKHK